MYAEQRISHLENMYTPLYLKAWRLKYTKLIWPVVLYGCETWSLTLREERRLRVFENRVLWRIFGPKRHEDWRKLHSVELYNLYGYFSSYIVRVMRWVEHVGRMREMWNEYKENLEIGWEDAVWINLVQDRSRWRSVVNAVMSLRFP
jgi:hypothetical protein